MSRLDRFSSRRPVLTATVLSLVSLMLVQCDRNASPEPPLATEAPAEAPTPTPVLAPKPVSALTRGELVSAAGQAASAYAQGQVPTETDPLVGRGFAVRIPFGCTGPSQATEGTAGDGVARWTWGPDRKTIQLSLTPGDWTGSALAFQPGPAANAAPAWEAVEGFWVPRPWLAAETCPDVRADPLQTGPAACVATDGRHRRRLRGRRLPDRASQRPGLRLHGARPGRPAVDRADRRLSPAAGRPRRGLPGRTGHPLPGSGA